MATTFNYTFSVTVTDDQLDAFRAEAIRRHAIRVEQDRQALADGTLIPMEGVEWQDATLDPTDIEDCANTLFGNAVDEILDTIEMDSSSHGPVSIEFGVD